MNDTDKNSLPDKRSVAGEPAKENVIAHKDNNAPVQNKNEKAELKEEVEEEVKESFQDEDVPVEPAVGNDGLEVGGEG